MKAELRIGNLVTDEFYDSFKTIITVESLNDKGINLEVESSDDLPEMQSHWIEPYYTFDKLRGIPLSPEWLERFGFNRLPHFNIMDNLIKDIGRRRILSIGAVGTANEMLWLCEVNATDPNEIDDLVCLWNFDYDGRLYVHHLQNIHHSLTGEELTLKTLVV